MNEKFDIEQLAQIAELKEKKPELYEKMLKDVKGVMKDLLKMMGEVAEEFQNEN